MCYTWRHDYGLTKPDDYAEYSFLDKLSSGMTEAERKSLWNSMAQIFDNDIAPHMEFRNE